MNACYGGTAAFFNAVNRVVSDRHSDRNSQADLKQPDLLI